MKKYYGYVCRTGCGHTTVVDKKYKQKRVYCAVCGYKDRMEYLGEFQIVKDDVKIAWGDK
ncbi:hypothetical protein [Bacillus phage BSTP8]|nr:putative DNA-directed RNA polymerase subunit B [Bacillus phage BSP19]AYJ76183.1 putative DNA-directed RNA polymerase subunit B [Bacillus phage BSP7]QQO90118.1 hypothetical protein BSTP5_057 [Bacillus phage BSTP5]QRI44326.1 hypothetical protein [Bacillus phage BSTP8]QRI44442.1 hypothetical protein [Bacillus phage BSTP10]QRI44490.1 hypothetical protein [Bacillus phage BSTP12]